MPPRKEIIATANVSTEVWPHPPLSLISLFDGMTITGRVVEVVNDVVVPRLPRGWIDRVLPRFPRPLTPDERDRLHAILKEYVRARMSRAYPITWEELESRLERIREKSKALLDELNDQSAASQVAWGKIWRASIPDGGITLTHDDLYPIVSGLHSASCRAAEAAKEYRDAGNKGDHRAPWIALVQGLRAIFEGAGGRATAPKGLRHGGYADPSPFVALVWTIMKQVIPMKLREHTQSPGAMAYQISLILSGRARS